MHQQKVLLDSTGYKPKIKPSADYVDFPDSEVSDLHNPAHELDSTRVFLLFGQRCTYRYHGPKGRRLFPRSAKLKNNSPS